MAKQTPWAVLLCKFKDNLSDPPVRDPEIFQKLFTTKGQGIFNVVRFFNDMSHGLLDLSGSQVFGWFTLDITLQDYGPELNDKQRTIKQADVVRLARKAATQAGIQLQNFVGGDCISFNVAVGGSQGGAVDGRPYAWGDYRWVQDNGTQSWGQEMGHGYGLDHSRRDGSTADYMDRWDIMSTIDAAFSAPDPHFRFRGPGLNAANMRSRGWLDQPRVWRSSSTSFDQVIQLRPLHRHDLPGLLAAEFPPFGRGYIVEFRVRDRWDAAIPRSAVLVHRFEDNHSYLMSGTKGQLDLVEGDVFDPFGNLNLGAPFLTPSRTCVEVLQIDERNQTATVRLCYARASSRFPTTLPGRIVGGVAADGGGIVIIGGRVVPVPPWDPMAQVLDRIAAYRSTELISDVHLRNMVKRQALTEIAENVQSAIEGLDSFGAPEQRVLSQEGEAAIAPQIFCISGRIINQQTRQGVMGLRVEAWDKDLIFNDLVGSAMTDTEGAFRIEFSASHFQECFLDRRPDLFFKLFRGDALIHSTEDTVLWNVDRGETPVVIAVEDAATKP